MDDLVAKYLAGEASVEEESQVKAWISGAPENEQRYHMFKKVFELSEKHFQSEFGKDLDIDVQQEWNQFTTNISGGSSRKPAVRWLRLAAGLILLMVAAWSINYFISRNRELQFETAENTMVVSMPDGSRVTLNHNSRLSYSQTFGKNERRVTLHGEAFFEVERNEALPFMIQVQGAIVEVLGTSFNVQGYDHRKELEVVVATGLVKVTAPDTHAEVRLSAGQKGIYRKDLHELTGVPNDNANFLSWNTRKIVFESTPLAEVVKALNEIYHSNIVIATDIPPTCQVTVSFDHQSLPAVLKVLESTLNLGYRTTGDKIEIIRAGC